MSFLDANSVQLVKNAGSQTDPNALNSLYNFPGLLQYVVGVYGATSPAASAPSFPVVAANGDVTVYNANAAPLNSSYPTFVLIPGLNGYRADYGNLAAAIAADTASFPNGQVNVLVVAWQGATAGPTIDGVNTPWTAALHVDTDGGELGDLLTTLEKQGGLDLSTTTIVGEGLGNDVGNQAAQDAGGVGNAIALNPANALSGYLPSDLTTYFQQSSAYETSSFLDTQLSVAASNQTLSTGDVNNPLLQHTFGVSWLTGQILTGNDSPLNPGKAVGPDNLPADNDPPAPSSPAGLLVSTAEVVQIISHDPNSIIGPKGSGTAATVPVTQSLPYTIEFTNEPITPAPVQQIKVTQTDRSSQPRLGLVPSDQFWVRRHDVLDPGQHGLLSDHHRPDEATGLRSRVHRHHQREHRPGHLDFHHHRSRHGPGSAQSNHRPAARGTAFLRRTPPVTLAWASSPTRSMRPRPTQRGP